MPKQDHQDFSTSELPGRSASDQATQLQRALALHQQGHLAEAEALYKKILIANPAHFDALQLLATIAGQQNRLSDAVVLFDRALNINPRHPASLNNCGNALQMLKRYEEALLSYDKAVAVQPDNADTWCNRGVVLQALKRYEDAVASYERAIALRPNYALAYNNRSFSLLELKRYEEAVLSYDKTIKLNANYSEPHYNRGNALLALKRYEEAVLSFEKAVKIKPDYVTAYNKSGFALFELKRFNEALSRYDKSIALNPNDPNSLYNHGNTLLELRRYEEAVWSYERVIKLKPDHAEAYTNCGSALLKSGLRSAEAEACFRQTLLLKPDCNQTYSNLLFFLTHDANLTPEALFHEHMEFGERLDAHLDETQPAHNNAKIADRRLTIGFVSGDFRSHPVAFLIEPVWQMFDCEKFKLIAYSNYDREDHVTERLREKVHLWRQVFRMSDLSLAEQIRADEVDILIDLSGHTGLNRLPVFALKPAPVQVSCIGYPATTGLKAIDYRLTDIHCAPVGLLDWQFSEKLVYLPSSNVFHTYNESPELNPLPALTSNGFTFGSFNRLCKIGDSVIELWSRVLNAVPASRLLLGDVTEKTQQERFTTIFEQHGVARDRLLFYPRVPMDDYLKLHHNIDLLLDTFPYSGGTTTNHGLSMGVPTITLAGQTLPSRHGVTILGRVGLERFVAETMEEFVEIAVYWSAHLDELNEIRSGIRDRITNSRTRSPEFVTRATESALRQMWQRWCAGMQPESFEVHL